MGRLCEDVLHHVRCTPDSCRSIASPNSAALGQSTKSLRSSPLRGSVSPRGR